jgi:hypothetical protein
VLGDLLPHSILDFRFTILDWADASKNGKKSTKNEVIRLDDGLIYPCPTEVYGC